MEAYAILKAVQMAIERGWTNLWCFSDAKVVIQCLINANPLKAHWSTQWFISTVINLVSYLDVVHFCWIPRKFNHRVCKWGAKFPVCGIFSPFDIPSHFVNILNHLIGP